jgi:hypothetical protein
MSTAGCHRAVIIDYGPALVDRAVVARRERRITIALMWFISTATAVRLVVLSAARDLPIGSEHKQARERQAGDLRRAHN